MAEMKETLEHELKLSAGAGFRLPELPGEPLEPRVFTSTYFDTSDHRLARRGVTLRRRVERRKGVWQLKLPRGVARLELEVPGGPDAPPPQMRELLTAYVRDGELGPVAKLRTRRAGVHVTNGDGPVADVTVDSVAVLVGRRITRSFRELEAELTAGGDKELRRIERALRAAGAADGDGRPKLFQALELEQPSRAEPKPSDPALDHLQAKFTDQYEAILAHDPGTRLGADPEELHQMRVATRRMRAFLRAARPLLDLEWAESLRGELEWLGGALGPVRDLDVLIEHLRDDASQLDVKDQRALRRLFELLEGERAAARERLLEALRSERYGNLLDRLEEAAGSPRPAGTAADSVTLAALARAEFRRLRKQVGKLSPEPTDEELHAVRIRGKRARYAAELAEASVGKRATRFIGEAKDFQDVLGAHQDSVIAEERVRGALGRVGGARLAFAAGRLVERQQLRRREARAAFPEAWKQLKKRGREAWT
jgi:CHAD domain-containing protein